MKWKKMRQKLDSLKYFLQKNHLLNIKRITGNRYISNQEKLILFNGKLLEEFMKKEALNIDWNLNEERKEAFEELKEAYDVFQRYKDLIQNKEYRMAFYLFYSPSETEIILKNQIEEKILYTLIKYREFLDLNYK